MNILLHTIKVHGWAAGVAVALLAAPAVAQEKEIPSLGPRRPLLEQLNRETKALYEEVQGHVVRVQLPPPQWINEVAARRNPMNKYANLSPEMRQELARQQRQTAGEAVAEGNPPPATTRSTTDAAEGGTYIVVPPPQQQQEAARDAVEGGKLESDFKPAPAFTPNNIGLVLDDQGHVLVPLYVEQETAGGQTIRLAGRDGEVREAKFVGSDRQTNLSLLKIEEPLGTPLRVGKDKPAEGSLTLCLAPHDGSGKLLVWNGGAQEYGVVFTPSGEMAGVARFGQFLSGSACKLIAEQIIRHGSVKRATLGVIISEIRKDDPLRQQAPVLGTRTAMRIDQVMTGSAAEKAGLRSGDLLLALAGEAVSDIPSFAAAIAARSGRTELQLLRDGKVIEVTVELQQR